MPSVYIESICLGLKLFTLGCPSSIEMLLYFLKEFGNTFLSPHFSSITLFQTKYLAFNIRSFSISLHTNKTGKGSPAVENNSIEGQQKDFRGQLNGYQRKEPKIRTPQLVCRVHKLKTKPKGRLRRSAGRANHCEYQPNQTFWFSVFNMSLTYKTRESQEANVEIMIHNVETHLLFSSSTV